MGKGEYVLGTIVNDDDTTPVSGETQYGAMISAVNYKNTRVIGILTGDDPEDGDDDDDYDDTFSDVTFFGTLNEATGEITSTVIGQPYQVGDAGNWAVIKDGGGTVTAQLYGSDAQGFGVTGTGTATTLLGSANKMDWTVAGAAFKETEEVAQTGTKAFEGYAVGVSLDMIDPDTASPDVPVFYRSTDGTATGGVSLTVDLDTGVVSGTLKAAGYDDGSDSSSNGDSIAATVGHASDLSKSAVVNSNFMVALMSGTIDSTTMNTDGSFLLCYPEDHYDMTCPETGTPFSYEAQPWVTMGEWSISYTQTGSPDHPILAPRFFSYFVAGEKSSIDSAMFTAMQSNNVTGTYRGITEGSYVSAATDMVVQLDGASYLNIDFASGSFTGKMNLDCDHMEHTLDVTGSAGMSGLTGTVSSWSFIDNGSPVSTTITGSSVNASYYGAASNTSAPASVGGIYSAKSSANGSIQAAFVGHKQ
jgi:hypothetical protein